jgi:hypothetical protein
MQKASLAVIAAAAVIALSGCAPTDGEIADVRSQVVETFRHYDSLCAGLPDQAERTNPVTGETFTENPFKRCLQGGRSGWTMPEIAAPEKAWREVKTFCGAITNESLAEICWNEAESQYLSRPQWYPERSPRS